MNYVPGLWLFILSAFVLSLILLLSWAKWRLPIGRAFLLLIGSAFLWVTTFILELTAVALPVKLLFIRIQFIGILLIPIAWVYLALVFSGRKIPFGLWICIGAITAISLVFVFIPFPNLFWGNPILVNSTMHYDYGPWFYFILEPFVYILLVYSLFIFARMLFQSPSIYRKQILLIIIATLLPAVVNVLYVFGITPVENINYSTATLCITGMLVGWALFRYKFLDLIPFARDLLVETMVDPVILLDNKQRILDLNPAAMKLFGHWKEVVGHLLSEMGENDIGAKIALHINPSLVSKSAEELLTIGAHMYNCSSTAFSQVRGLESAYIIVLHDVTERELLYRQIEEISRRDPLTGVYNRRELERHINQLCNESYVQKKPLSFIMLDIDFFKEINDTYGHEAGDKALETLAKILFKAIQPSDVVGRFGGDEFVVCALDCDSEKGSTLAESIRASVAQCQLYSEGSPFSMRISLGVVTVGGKNDSTNQYGWDSLLGKADKALYAAKQRGKNRVFMST